MRDFPREVVRAAALIVMTAVLAGPVEAKYEVVYSFQGGSSGANPGAPVTFDSSGNLYGTTDGGGGSCGCGTVFKIGSAGYAVLHAFDKTDGAGPSSNLVFDNSGNVYGTTFEGGVGAGTVFKLRPDGSEAWLYSFLGGNDGSTPYGNIAIDSAGNIYGTTTTGGGGTNCENGSQFGCGTVFEVAPDGTKTTVHAFQGGSDDGAGPGGLIIDSSGDLLVVTGEGGSCSLSAYGCGTVFKIPPDGKGSILYAFQGGNDGGGPIGLVADGNGNLFGATVEGGSETACSGFGCGTVFKISTSGSESVLYAFQNGRDGAYPQAGVILDQAGNLYGTTEDAGGSGCKGGGCGIVFKISPTGQETILRRLGMRTGTNPLAPLVLGKYGLLYGTAQFGGAHNDGVVFSIKK